MAISEATKIRCVRALTGMSSKDFAERMGICAGTLTAWEKGRTSPVGSKREVFANLCEEFGIAFSPSGFPFPVEDVIIFKEKEECISASSS